MHKFEEVQQLMPSHIELLSLHDIGCHEEIPETANTIEGNARQKALFVKNHYNLDCFADDTGLEVDSLNGEPGVYSARYAGDGKNSDENMKKLLDNLANKTDRSARFKTVIALVFDGKEQFFAGICKGKITMEPKGSEGFGYDPIFEPQNSGITFAQMSQSEKSKFSHRGKAIAQLISYLSQ